MNKQQRTALAVAAVNFVVVALFPPYDYLSPLRASAPAFDGFYFAFADNGPRQVNSALLQLELLVVALNAAIAWLLLKAPDKAGTATWGTRWQRIVLIGAGANLALAILFPPMQLVRNVTKAVLPSFDGFYFVFGEHGDRLLVVSLLYMEVIFILVNAAILLAVFRRPGEEQEAQRRAEAMLRMRR
jgi:hypothetical protein